MKATNIGPVILVLLLALIIIPRSNSKIATTSTVLLWAHGAPGAAGGENADKPSMKIYTPRHPNGTAVVICAGGAYRVVSVDVEGNTVARWANELGITAFVLKYRVAPRYHNPAATEDILRAIRFARYHAAEYNINPSRVGVMGFSAGGHLASIALTHYNEGTRNPSDPVDRMGSRPDFGILGYPVITLLQPFAHEESVQNLLGENPSEELRHSLSNEFFVTPQTPPVFLFHTGQDKVVPAENSILFYKALRAAKVPVELHIFERGQHGAGVANGDHTTPNLPAAAIWTKLAASWLKERGLLEPP